MWGEGGKHNFYLEKPIYRKALYLTSISPYQIISKKKKLDLELINDVSFHHKIMNYKSIRKIVANDKKTVIIEKYGFLEE